MFSLGKSKDSKTSKKVFSPSPKVSSTIVRMAHKVSASTSSNQFLKIEGKYYRIKELG